MISRDRPAYKSRVFGEKGVFFHFPRYLNPQEKTQELFIGEKPFVPYPGVVNDEVINFFLYYVDDSQEEECNIKCVTKIPDPGLIIQVRYDVIDDHRALFLYDHPGGTVRNFSIAQGNLTNLPGNFHGFPGSVRLRVNTIPADPNIGWP